MANRLTMMKSATMGFVLIFSAATAQAQAAPPPVLLEDFSMHYQLDTEPLNDAELFVQYLRPLDDSDPEMQLRTEAFFAMTPCGGEPHGVCAEALQLLIDGGDRLAEYLIRQVERNEAEGFPDRGTYLHLLGHTETEVAFSYLADQFDARRAAYARGDVNHQSLLSAIEALGRTRRKEVIEKVRPILEAEESTALQVAAVNALDRVQVRHGPLPAVESGLRALEQKNAERRAAAHARSSEQRLMITYLTQGQDPWQGVQRRIDMIRVNPGHMRP